MEASAFSRDRNLCSRPSWPYLLHEVSLDIPYQLTRR
ncbi:hypothetical protein PBI_CAMILLE_78 [Microbacterium phage Camille]|nr:hypothetical protein PBI_CAMILLE_78 [Microbacterium phage Camille]